MANKQDHETRTILRKLSIYVVLFYVAYYLVSSLARARRVKPHLFPFHAWRHQVSIILVGGFQAGWDQLGKFPFRITLSEFNPHAGGAALGEPSVPTVMHTSGHSHSSSSRSIVRVMAGHGNNVLLFNRAHIRRRQGVRRDGDIAAAYYPQHFPLSHRSSCETHTQATRRAWDYVVTTSLLHFVICCIGGSEIFHARTLHF